MKKTLLVGLAVLCMGLLSFGGAIAVDTQAQQGGAPANPFEVSTLQLPDGTGARGGSITIDNIDNPKTFNPITQSEASSSAVTSLLNAALIDTTGLPTLAQSLEISPDQTTVTLGLREGTRFSDGAPLTASDVVFTLESVVFNPDVSSTLKDAWRVSGSFPSVTALDDLTVRISAPVTFSGLLAAIASTPSLRGGRGRVQRGLGRWRKPQ